MSRTFCCLLLMVLPSCKGGAGSDDLVINQRDRDNAVVCFMYHRFGDARFPATNISTSDFESHLRYLKENGFVVLTFSAAMELLRSDTPAKKVAVITIDDGYKSFYDRGLPLLKKYNMPATLFINTATVGSADYMSWEDLKNAMASGVEVGNHTHSHAHFMNEEVAVRYDRFEADIVKSRKIISEQLGITPEIFAYPYGEFDKGMKRVVKNAGFKYAAVQHSGVAYAGTDPYQIPRFPMAEAYAGLNDFAGKASMLPLKVVRQTPDDTVLPDGNKRPELRLTVQNEGLQTSRMQCFVQGGACELEITEENADEVVVIVRSAGELLRRRTLFTVTVPDSSGAWHWYSHLWINRER